MPLTNQQKRREAENEIKQLMGFVPEFYSALPDSGFWAAWQLERDVELGETTLDVKTKELIGLAVASHIKCKYCIYFHTEAAKSFGATDQEIKEASLMGGMTVAMSNAVTGSQVDFDRFKKDVNRAIKHIMSTMKTHGTGAPAQSVH